MANLIGFIVALILAVLMVVLFGLAWLAGNIGMLLDKLFRVQ